MGGRKGRFIISYLPRCSCAVILVQEWPPGDGDRPGASSASVCERARYALGMCRRVNVNTR